MKGYFKDEYTEEEYIEHLDNISYLLLFGIFVMLLISL